MTSINRTLRWAPIDRGDWVLIEAPAKIRGWVLRDDEVFIARSSDGEVRVEFPTLNEAEDFLWAIAHMEQS